MFCREDVEHVEGIVLSASYNKHYDYVSLTVMPDGVDEVFEDDLKYVDVPDYVEPLTYNTPPTGIPWHSKKLRFSGIKIDKDGYVLLFDVQEVE